MTGRDSNTHLLLGLLALQNDFISRNQLLSAFGAWIADKSRRIDELLVEQHIIDSFRNGRIGWHRYRSSAIAFISLSNRPKSN